eukprot:jgi/Botrbrau1/13054/Bobra.0187s0016.1
MWACVCQCELDAGQESRYRCTSSPPTPVAVSCEQVNVEALPEGPENPYGNAFKAVETDLLTETAAQRVADPQKARIWKIKNPATRHPATGSPVAYKLVPKVAPTLLAGPSAVLHRRGLFATKNLWVTPYHDEEKYPAGNYTIQSTGGQGLPTWTAQVGPLRGRPYRILCSLQSFGIQSGDWEVDVTPSSGIPLASHTIPRPEDFPVMPVEVVGFTLAPFGFFESNPSVDIPPLVNKASTSCCNGA